MLTEVSSTVLYTFHALNNLIIANMLEIGAMFFSFADEIKRSSEMLSNL